MEWINVKDGMPTNEDAVLTIRMGDISEYCHPYTAAEAQLICFYSSDLWWEEAFPEKVKEDNIVKDVTHWMPLPDPPKAI